MDVDKTCSILGWDTNEGRRSYLEISAEVAVKLVHLCRKNIVSENLNCNCSLVLKLIWTSEG